MKESFIDVGTGGRLRYLRGGNPERPTVLMLHGVHLAADYFERSLYPYLKADYSVIALDLRGHAKSFRSDEHYTLENMARDVVAFHRAVIRAPCHVVGYSMGGNVALRASTSAPEIVEKLVIVDIAPFVNKAGLERLVAAQKALPESFPSFEAVRDFFYVAYRGVARLYIDELLVHMWRKEEDGQYRRAYDRRVWEVPPEVATSELESLATAASELSFPVLVLRGGNSDILSREGAARFVAMLRDGRIVEVPDTDHGLLHERPEECSRVIREFLG